MMRYHRDKAFTLAELLIALSILGVIATFTIPKVLSGARDTRLKSIAKETVAMVSGAYAAYQLNNAAPTSTSMGDLSPYMNYVRTESGTVFDQDGIQAGTRTCGSGGYICLRLHNGALLIYESQSFNGTAITNAIHYHIDPDGKSLGSAANSPGKAVEMFLYYNGAIRDAGSLLPNTC